MPDSVISQMTTPIALPAPPTAPPRAPVPTWTGPQPPISGTVNSRRVAAYTAHHRTVPRRAADFSSQPSAPKPRTRHGRNAFSNSSASTSSASNSLLPQSANFDIILYPYPVSVTTLIISYPYLIG